MKTNTVQSRLIVALAGVTCGAPAAHAACDLVVPSGTTVTLTESRTVNCFKVQGTGTLDIAGTATLTVDGNDEHCASTISGQGTVRLLSNGSTLAFTKSDHILKGGGAVEGCDDAAVVSIASGVTLLSKVAIVGQLLIDGAGDFINAGRVVANVAGGTLKIAVTGRIDDLANSGPVDDDNFRWGVTTSGTAVLLFAAEPGGLSGHMYVATGDLKAGDTADDVDVHTTGDLLQEGGEIITGASDSFCFSGGCPD